jgi:hypothetical protein
LGAASRILSNNIDLLEHPGSILQSYGHLEGPHDISNPRFNIDEEPQPSNSNDVEFIIKNLYNKMKNLESKYIDLANFYKQELVKSSKKDPPPTIASPRSQSHEEL